MEIEVKFPELGEGIASGDVLEVLVKVGDQVKKDQGILEIETDKATVTLPSSAAGTVAKILVKVGDSVPVGTTVITLEAAAAAGAAPAAAAPPKAAAAPTPAAAPKPAPAAPAPAAPAPPSAPASVAPAVAPQVVRPAAPAAVALHETGGSIPAGPAVRRFAREVGVDLRRVNGTGSGGRITREDVVEAVRRSNQGGTMVATAPAAVSAGPALQVGAENDGWGPVRVEKMSKIRKTIANKMHESWTTVPRVTNQDDADVTELERIRQFSKDDYAKKGIKLTTLPFLIKSVAMALKSHPLLNASIDMANGNLIYKDYVNVGLAVDSDRGLVVPSLRHADQLSIGDIARHVSQLAENVRTNSFSIDDLRGSTFTISNLGAIGGTYSTPIINTPEVAILLVGRSRKMPVVIDDQIVIRLMMPLSLSYDHRVVDGAAAARFLNDVIGYLKAPGRMLLAP